MAGRPPKERSFANMLNIAIREAVEGGEKTKLRAVADALVDKAMKGDVQAIKEIADRLDGKVPQGVIGGEEDDPPIMIEDPSASPRNLARIIAFALAEGQRSAKGSDD